MNPAVDNGVVRELARRYASGDGVDYAAFASALAADSALHAQLQKPRRRQDNGDIVVGRDEPRGAEIAAEQRAVCQGAWRARAAAGGGGDDEPPRERERGGARLAHNVPLTDERIRSGPRG